MSLSEKKPAPFFSQPVRQIVLMLIVVGLVTAGAWMALPSVSQVFLSNPWLNGVIFGVFVVGVLACFWQVLTLISSVGWIEGFAGGRPGVEIAKPPQMLTPLANLLRSRGARMQLSSSSTRSILDSVATRIEEARDITRYIVNMLIFLGLLGTFYGLATTVPAVVETIRSLAPQDGETSISIFDRLMGGLESQLEGMGTAFSSSLLGLAGSLVVGLLELFAGHGQNRFYRELEEWLSSITRVGFAAGDGEGESGMVAAALDQMAEQMELMKSMIAQSDTSWAMADERFAGMATALDRLSEQLAVPAPRDPAFDNIVSAQERSNETQTRIAEGHEGLKQTQERMAEAQERAVLSQDRLVEGQAQFLESQNRIAEGQEVIAAAISEVMKRMSARPTAQDADGDDTGDDAEARMRLRSIDTQLLKILEEIAVGRQESLGELRGDINQLIRAINTLGNRLGG